MEVSSSDSCLEIFWTGSQEHSLPLSILQGSKGKHTPNLPISAQRLAEGGRVQVQLPMITQDPTAQ